MRIMRVGQQLRVFMLFCHSNLDRRQMSGLLDADRQSVNGVLAGGS